MGAAGRKPDDSGRSFRRGYSPEGQHQYLIRKSHDRPEIRMRIQLRSISMKLSKSNIEIQKLLNFQKFLHTIAVVEVNHVIERKAYLDALRRWRDKRVI